MSPDGHVGFWDIKQRILKNIIKRSMIGLGEIPIACSLDNLNMVVATGKIYQIKEDKEFSILPPDTEHFNGKVAISSNGSKAMLFDNLRQPSLILYDANDQKTIFAKNIPAVHACLTSCGSKIFTVNEKKKPDKYSLIRWDVHEDKYSNLFQGIIGWAQVLISLDTVNKIAFGLENGDIWIMNIENQIRKKIFQLTDLSHIHAVSKNERMIALISKDGHITVIDMHQEVSIMEHKINLGASNQIYKMAFLHDKHLIIIHSRSTILEIDISKNRIIRESNINTKNIKIALSQHQDYCAYIENQNDCVITKIDHDKFRRKLTFDHIITRVHLVSDNTLFICTDQPAVIAWNLIENRQLYKRDGMDDVVDYCALSHILLLSRSNRNVFEVINAHSGDKICTINNQFEIPKQIIIIGERYIAGSWYSGRFVLYNITDGQEYFSQMLNIQTMCNISRDSIIFFKHEEHRNNIYDLFQWHEDRKYTMEHIRKYEKAVIALSISPNDEYLAVLFLDHQLEVWALSPLACISSCTLDETEHLIDLLAIFPDGQKVITATKNKNVSVWSCLTGNMMSTFTGESLIRSIAISKQGIVIAGDQGGSVHLLSW